ncbi:MAG: response regulator [Euryarchaeota archaeon]|nr:response regulator [Euryarchaeota archaeon]MBU4222003.1 response regulator [Euryarchaeota archaeon]MBU4339558.1 response regulator [Euryarchaeota archaeon]MBU4454805.1 response regulator [Euryarchaeota archaeon]
MMKGNKIMVVEDESIIAEDIRMSLINKGYNVPCVASMGEDAVEKAREHKPDLILMDIMLGGKMDGIEAAGIIHSKYDIPVIFLTAYCDEKILERAKVTEPFGYLIKPFKDRDMYINIEMSLYKHKIEIELKESKKFFESILEGIVTGVWVTDKNDVIVYANNGMKAIIPDLAVGVKIINAWEFFKPYYLKARESLQPFHYEGVPFVVPGAGPKYHSGWLTPRIEDGKFNGMMCTIESIRTQV